MNDAMRAIRRQLTILNCDLVDSTTYADQLDPEVFRGLLQHFFDQSVVIVERNAGRLVQNMGDGFVAIFGYPRTHRMAEVNAINCGLELGEMMATDQLFLTHAFKARFGVATGLVVLSTITHGGLFDNIPFGSPAHRAARLQALAPHGGVTVDQTTYDQVNRQFHFSSMGAQELKGFGEASSVWQVEGRQTLESRFQEHTELLTPMIGRVHEIALLTECWERAKDGDGQVIVLTGEPGVGKSRSIYELRQRVAEDEPTQIMLQCEEGFENTALHPWARFIERRADLMHHETLADKDAKLRARVRDDFGVDEDLARFFVSLTAYSQFSDENSDVTPEQRLAAIRSAVVERLLFLAESKPLVLVVEDAQWIDPTSRLLVETLIKRAETSKILVLISSRSELPMFLNQSRITQLSLNRLSRDQVRDLAWSVVGANDNAERYIGRIVERADGNPLYVEELARSAKMSVEAGAEDTWSEAEDSDAPLPERLQTLLEARLDRLAHEEKALTEAASVIGQEFEMILLAQLLDRRETQLAKDAASLVQAGIFIYRDLDSPGHYRFRHALLQQAAYANVLKGASTVYHRRLIDLLRANDPDIDAKSPEIIAHHLTRSEQYAEAARMWLGAAKAARETGSNLEALGRLDHALHRVVPHLDPPDLPLRMAYQLARGEVINAHYGPVKPDARAAFDEAAVLATQLGDTEGLAKAHTELFHLTYVQSNFQDALASSDILIKQPSAKDRPDAKAMGYLGAGMCRFALGEFTVAKSNFEASLKASAGRGDVSGSYASKALIYLALINQIFGNANKATSLRDQGIAKARKQDANILSAALGNSFYLDYMQSHPARALQTAEELLVLTEQKGFIMWYYQAQFWQGWALVKSDDSHGLDLMEEAMERFFQAEEIIETTIFFCAQSEAYLYMGDLEHADVCVDRALGMAGKSGERFYEVPLLRQKIACLREQPVPSLKEITKLTAKAQRLAKAQEARAFV